MLNFCRKDVADIETLEFLPFVRAALEYEWIPKKKDIFYANDCKFFIVQKGSADLYVDGEKFELTECSQMYIPMGSSYRLENGTPLQVYMINFDFVPDFSHIKDPLGNTEGTSNPELPHYKLPEYFDKAMTTHSALIFEYIKACLDEFITRGPFWRDLCSSILKQGLIRFLREYLIHFDTKTPIANKALVYARKNARNPLLSNEEIAAYVGYHPYYVSQLVKESTGMTLRQYLVHTRLRVAKNLLCSTKTDIAAIAKRCGFSDVTYFNRVFKTSVGMTPGEYRKTHLIL